MTCTFCEEFWDRFWANSDAWERTASNETQLLSEESDQSWKLIQRAGEIGDIDPASAFRLYLQAIESGSIWAMERVGWHYWAGIGVAADPYTALEHYHRAISRGSWTATISYARLLSELGHQDECEKVLEDGVASDFTPAYFWLAWTRSVHAKTPKVRRDVRPLLEYAAQQGHPAAKMFLARWMARGSLGLREIPRGCLLVVREALRDAFHHKESRGG